MYNSALKFVLYYGFFFLVYFTAVSKQLDYIVLMTGWQVNDDEQTRKNPRLSRIRTHGLGIQPTKVYAPDRKTNGTGDV
jgi:hypothetical protein